MKRLWLSMAGMLLTMCFSFSVQAHIGNRLFPIYEITDAELVEIDVRDGSIEDWEKTVGEPSLTTADFVDLSGIESASYDPSDLDFRIWLGWNQNHHLLFFGFEGADNRYINEYQGGEYTGDVETCIICHDSVTFMVDGDHSGGGYPDDPGWTEEEKQLNRRRTCQAYDAIAVSPDGQYIGYSEPSRDWAFFPPYTDGGGAVMGEVPTISVIEFSVTLFDELIWNSPEESTPSTLLPGKVIGFNIIVQDHDSYPSEYHGVFSLTGGFTSCQYANRFVDGILLGEGVVPGDTAVENVTWEQIKASFRSN